MNVFYHPELPLGQPPAQDDIDQKFAAFDEENPLVYEAIKYRALAWGSHLRMKEIYEAVRSSMQIKLNNSFTSRYADKVIEEYPELAERFHRRARAKRTLKLVYTK